MMTEKLNINYGLHKHTKVTIHLENLKLKTDI